MENDHLQNAGVMDQMPYDHNKKAGNQGDIAKHVALTAAISGCLTLFKGDVFRYADTFAGYAWNPLLKAVGYEWQQGIGQLVKHRGRFGENAAVSRWAEVCLPSDDLAGERYPGSSVLVRDILKANGVRFRLSLWDIGDDPVSSLRGEFGENATVYNRSARSDEDDVRNATFLFIDPPGLKTQKSKSEYPLWQEIKSFLSLDGSRRTFMMWLPIKAVTMRKNVRLRPPGEDELSDKVRSELTAIGFEVLKVRYLPGGRTIGCQIIHNFSGDVAKEINEALSTVVDIAKWQDQLPTGIPAYSTF